MDLKTKLSGFSAMERVEEEH